MTNTPTFLISILVPLAVGTLWYHPAVLGRLWAKEAGLTEERLAGANRLLTLFLTLLLSGLLAATLITLTIHQMGAMQTVVGDETAETKAFMAEFMTRYGSNYRSFKHGALHGILATITFVLPVLGITTLFERRGWKYLLVHLGFWGISLAIMGGLICMNPQ